MDLQIYIYLRLDTIKISSTRLTISLNSTHETSNQEAGSPRGSVVRSFPVLTDSERRKSVLEKRSKARQHGPNTSKRRATPKAAKAEREETLRDSSLTHKYGNRGTAICLQQGRDVRFRRGVGRFRAFNVPTIARLDGGDRSLAEQKKTRKRPRERRSLVNILGAVRTCC